MRLGYSDSLATENYEQLLVTRLSEALRTCGMGPKPPPWPRRSSHVVGLVDAEDWTWKS